MSETEVKTALASTAPFYINQASDYPDMHYLVAETEAESYAFTLIDGKVAAFSVMHILPPGQLPFLPPGQQPTVSILRGLITKQTWTPAEINKGDTWWFSDVSGAPLCQCLAMQSRVRRGMVALWAGRGPKSRRAACEIDRGPHEAVVHLVSIELRRQYSSATRRRLRVKTPWSRPFGIRCSTSRR